MDSIVVTIKMFTKVFASVVRVVGGRANVEELLDPRASSATSGECKISHEAI